MNLPHLIASNTYEVLRPARFPLDLLVDAIGTSRFERILFEMAHQQLGCLHVTAFRFLDAGDPNVIVAENDRYDGLSRHVATRYLSTYWRMDPLYRICQDHDHGLLMAELKPSDIDYADYRRHCYDRVNLASRVSLTERRQGIRLQLNFYKGSPFSDIEKTLIADHGATLLAIVWRHASERTACGLQAMLQPDFGQRLRQLVPELSNRERQVCELIAKGVTSEGIALALGISQNTVLTYRKRSYSRLQISSQNELIRMIMR